MLRKYRPFGYWPVVRSKPAQWNWLDEEHTKAVDGVAGGRYNSSSAEFHFGGNKISVTSNSGFSCDVLRVRLTDTASNVFFAGDSQIEFHNIPIVNEGRLKETSHNGVKYRVSHIDSAIATANINPSSADIYLLEGNNVTTRWNVDPPSGDLVSQVNGLSVLLKGHGSAAVYPYNNGVYINRFYGNKDRWWVRLFWHDSTWRVASWDPNCTGTLVP